MELHSHFERDFKIFMPTNICSERIPLFEHLFAVIAFLAFGVFSFQRAFSLINVYKFEVTISEIGTVIAKKV